MKIPFFSKAKMIQAIQTPVAQVKSSGALTSAPSYATYRSPDGRVFAYSLLTPTILANYFEQIHPVYTAVMRIANAVASLPVQLIDKTTEEEQTQHPALKLLNHPNSYSEKTRFEYIQALVINYVLLGNAYIITTGNVTNPPLELFSLNPLNLEYGTDQYTGMLSEIRYTSSQTPIPQNTPARMKFTKGKDNFFYSDTKLQQLYAIHNFNVKLTQSSPVGSSELIALYQEISLYVAALVHNGAILSNGARPTGILTLKTPSGTPAVLSEESYERIKQQVNENWTGAHNAGRPILLEGGLEWQSAEMSPRDLDFLNMLERNEDAIYNLLGVPTQLIKPVKTTANNLVNVRKEFYENRILPLADLFYAHISNALLPRYREGKTTAADKLEFRVNRDKVDVLLQDRIEYRKSYESSLILTVNEKRKIFNLPPVPGGDKIVDPNGRPIAGEDAIMVIGEGGTVTAANPDLKPPLSVKPVVSSGTDTTPPSDTSPPAGA